MEISNQKSTPIKKWRVFGFIACVVVFLGLAILAIWAIWMFGAAELTAKCDNGLTVWRRNPGAASSYIYEVRDGITIIKSDLRMKELHEYSCVFLGGG